MTAASGVSNHPAFLRSALSPSIIIIPDDAAEGVGSRSLKRRLICTASRGCQPEKILLNSLAQKAAGQPVHKSILKLVKVAFLKSVVCHSCHIPNHWTPYNFLSLRFVSNGLERCGLNGSLIYLSN